MLYIVETYFVLCEVGTDVHLYKAHSVAGYQGPERE